jgi:phytoene dehydrogenase-like protein
MPATPPVIVVGASLGGLAAAARLAKLGHAVTVIDDATSPARIPDFIELPAAWRDLFRKSGRILDAALAEAGLDLVPAPPILLGDGVALPTDRGEQYRTLTEAYGSRAAQAWRDLLDGLDHTWQVVRRLGLETDLDAADPAVARLLADRASVASIADRIGTPALAAHVRDVALDRGTDPTDAPAWWAVQLVVRRTFGLWTVVDASGTPQPGSALADLLAARLRHRGVRTVAASATVISDRDGGAIVETTAGTYVASAAISATDLWRHRALTGRRAARVPRRLGPVALPSALLAQSPSGRPAWSQRSTWAALEPVACGSHLAYAGSGTVAGDLPWARLLVGALAAYAVHESITGVDVRPANRSGHRGRTAPIHTEG